MRDAAAQIQEPHGRVRAQKKKEDARVNEVKETIQNKVEDQVAEEMRAQIQDQIHVEIALQVNAQINDQIPSFLPTLKQQLNEI